MERHKPYYGGVLAADVTVRRAEDRPGEGGFHPHVHSYWEIKRFQRRDRTIGVCLVAPGAVHAQTPRKWLSHGWVLSLQQPWINFSLGGRVQDCSIPYEAVDALCPGGIMALVEKIAALDAESPVFETVRLSRALLQVLWDAVAVGMDKATHESSRSFSATERARRFIERNYHQPGLSVTTVAEHVGVTAGHLANLFKQERLDTVRQSIIQVRLNAARILLKSGRHTVKEVAAITGWHCPFYFSNSFRQRFGHAPTHVIHAPATRHIRRRR